jgi:hypothetical protein
MSGEPRDERSPASSERSTTALLEAAGERLARLVNQSDDPARPPRTVWAWLRGSFGLAAGLLAGAALLGEVISALAPTCSLEEKQVPRFKHEVFLRQQDDYDLVFVGSSRVFRSFDAVMFDREVAREGERIRSFNFGLAGMRLPEIRYTAHWILDQQPAKLRWLLIELSSHVIDVHGEPLHELSPFSRRVIHWHSPRITFGLCRAILGSSRQWAVKAVSSWSHLHHMGYRSSQAGLGIPAVRALLGKDQPGPRDPLEAWQLEVIEREQGHISLDEQAVLDRETRRRHRLFLREQDSSFTIVENLEERGTAGPPEPLLLDALLQLERELVERGVVPIFVVCPPVHDLEVARFSQRRTFGLETVFAYQDPARNAEFYDVGFLFDSNHLNADGSHVLTRKLARDFVRRAPRPASR